MVRASGDYRESVPASRRLGAAALAAPRQRRRSDRIVVLVVCALLAGCGAEDLDTTYGRSRASRGGTSVNGTAVLAGLFRREGSRVSTWHRLSPKLQRADVIVWAPDRYRPPTVDERLYLEQWLADRADRTLIYIGRDYDAAIAYWEYILPLAPVSQAPELARRLSTARAAQDASRAALPEEEFCDWFVLRRRLGEQRIRRLQGPWSRGVDSQQADIRVATRFDVPDDSQIKQWREQPESPWIDEPRFEVLLEGDGIPLVTRIRRPVWSTSQLLVITNGSFLLNLPLVNAAHRQLAGRLVAECGSPEHVVFLESGPTELDILDSEPTAAGPTGFELFTTWPVGVLTFHLTVLGIVACLVWFPIFGRPRSEEGDRPTDFGKHVEAVAELLAATRDREYATRQIQRYHEQVKRETSK